MATYYATGHRPDKLGGYSDENRIKLEDFAYDVLSNISKFDTVIVGMAQGWDQAVAVAAIRLGIRLVAVIPHKGHGDNWPIEARARYNVILTNAQEVVRLNVDYSKKALLDRNIWMIDHGQYCLALWDGSEGGTGHCVQHSKKRKKKIVNLWQQWIKFQEKYRCPNY